MIDAAATVEQRFGLADLVVSNVGVQLFGAVESFTEDRIGVSAIFPSGMVSRHLETSEAAQPAHLRRPIANDGDLDAMIASNPEMAPLLVGTRWLRAAPEVGVEREGLECLE